MRTEDELKRNQAPIILMVDDDEDDLLLARDALKESKAPGTLFSLGDGVELLEYLTRSGRYSKEIDTPMPALILLDLNMPRKDGRQALQEIKSIAALKEIPIVVLTTSRGEKDIAFCRCMGAKDLLTKPVEFDRWVEMMRSLAEIWLAG